MAASATYPVHVQGRLDERLSRWLWLVKWLLVLPHYVVLAFLWLAFGVLTVVAFFAILFTGRYPRSIFEFNLGVMRWQWRVSYYAYGALGTDRYPPFTLADVPDYPARLDVAYPDHLSRGLVLVKWWLLAIPHYLIVGVFVGGGAWIAWNDDANWQWSWGGGGLVGLLVLVSALALAFSGRYPRSLFDLILGMNRWALRVLGYAALMTDVYPPFRLDMGGDDPDGVLTLRSSGDRAPATGTGWPQTATAAAAAGVITEEPLQAPAGAPYEGPPPPAGAGWTAGRVIGAVIGAVLVLSSAGLLAGGGALAWAWGTQRDAAGFLTTDPIRLSTDGYALRSGDLKLDGTGPDWAYPDAFIGAVRVRGESATGEEVFLGLAPAGELDTYLDQVRYAEVTDLTIGTRQPVTYRIQDGGAPAEPPTTVDGWAAQAAGPGEQSLVWEPEPGSWGLVAMNADGSPGVQVDVDLAAEVPGLPWLATGLIVGGLVLLIAGAVAIAIAASRASNAASAQRPVRADQQGPAQG